MRPIVERFIADMRELFSQPLADHSVPPGKIHTEPYPAERLAAFIVRSQRSGTFAQNNYNPETAAAEPFNAPTQIPYHLG